MENRDSQFFILQTYNCSPSMDWCRLLQDRIESIVLFIRTAISICKYFVFHRLSLLNTFCVYCVYKRRWKKKNCLHALLFQRTKRTIVHIDSILSCGEWYIYLPIYLTYREWQSLCESKSKYLLVIKQYWLLSAETDSLVFRINRYRFIRINKFIWTFNIHIRCYCHSKMYIYNQYVV